MRDRDEYSEDLDKQDVTGRPLTRREQKQQEKFEKQAEAIRRQQEALEAKHREALEKETARQARIQEKQEEKLRRLREKEEKRRAKEEKKEAKRRAREEARNAKGNGGAAKKGDGSGGSKSTQHTALSSSHAPYAAKKAGGKTLGKKKKGGSLSAQQSIPYKEMGRDGICRVQDRLYSKTIHFYDINYQLAQNEDKSAIFENWCDFLNYFDSTIRFQLSFINHKSNLMEYENVIRIESQGDSFDDVRMEYAQMLRDQLAKGNNGLIRTKYITFAIEADNIMDARPKLERIEADILNNFKVLGVQAYPLNGVERLQIMYETFNPEQKAPFTFQYDQLIKSGLSTKNFIAPTSFGFAGTGFPGRFPFHYNL